MQSAATVGGEVPSPKKEATRSNDAQVASSEAGGDADYCNPDSLRCDFYLRHKKRFCKMEKRPGGTYRYCHQHNAELLGACGDGDNVEGRRVPCPINPRHTIYERELKRHVRVCPDLRHDASQLPCFELNAHGLRGASYTICGNDGGGSSSRTSALEPAKEGQPIADEDAAASAGSTRTARFTHRDLDPEALSILCERVVALYREKIAPKIVVSHAALVSSDAAARHTAKHSSQHASLLELVNSGVRTLCHPAVALLELGAGKGGLAHAIVSQPSSTKDSNVTPPRLVFVVDSGGFRRKLDGCHSRSDTAFRRLRMNIKDLVLDKVDELSRLCTVAAGDLVVVGKHLCGSCSDFAISCITTRLPQNCHCGVLVLATCCHQLCELQHINPISPDDREICLFGEVFTEEEFQAITSMSSWAVSGSHATDERQREVGVACKRIIDTLRVEYLKHHLDYVALHEYVASDVTAENVCIVAYRRAADVKVDGNAAETSDTGQ